MFLLRIEFFELNFNAMNRLEGKKIAILVANGFEQVELTEPKKALDEAGATTHVVSPEENKVKAWDKTDWGIDIDVDVNLKRANPDDYDALVLPGGQLNPDFLRMDETAVNFVKSFANSGKPIGAICHGPWTLIEADVVKGKKMTSYPSIKTDLKNAGAHWVDQEVVVDGKLITSRKPDDIPAFNEKIIEEFAKVGVEAHA